jgi:RNA polymerase sigma-70 factor (ECF subfamily)
MDQIPAPVRAIIAAESRSDADLLAAGDDASFERIFDRHVRAIYAFAAARIGRDHAEDVTADTFVTAFRMRATFDPTATSARPWLYGIAVNVMRRHSARDARWRGNASREPFAVDVDDLELAEDRIDAERMADQLAATLARLSPGERDVLLMHVLGGMTHRQIAVALGIRTGSAKSRLSRARARLHAELSTGTAEGSAS